MIYIYISVMIRQSDIDETNRNTIANGHKSTIFAIWNLLLTLCSTQLVIYPCKMGTIIRPDITTWYILLTLFEEVAAHVDIEFVTTNLSRVKTIP